MMRLLFLFVLPATSVAQTVHSATSFKRFDDSLSATLNCGGSGFAYDNKLKNRYSKTCCAYHTKKVYDSLIARIDREEHARSGENPPKEESYCEKLNKCISKAYQQKKPLIEKLWNEYEAGLKKAGAIHDADYTATIKRLNADCFMAPVEHSGMSRQPNPYGPSLIAIKLTNYHSCLTLAIELANNLNKIYQEIEEPCLSQVMGKSLVMPLCPDMTDLDLTGLYGDIAELYDIIQATKVRKCGQPAAKGDCCTVIPSKN